MPQVEVVSLRYHARRPPPHGLYCREKPAVLVISAVPLSKLYLVMRRNGILSQTEIRRPDQEGPADSGVPGSHEAQDPMKQ